MQSPGRKTDGARQQGSRGEASQPSLQPVPDGDAMQVGGPVAAEAGDTGLALEMDRALADLKSKGAALASGAVTRVFPAAEIGFATGIQNGIDYRINHDVLQYRDPVMGDNWDVVGPYDEWNSGDESASDHDSYMAVMDYIKWRVGSEGESALDASARHWDEEGEAVDARGMVPEPLPSAMPRLVPVSQRRDWDRCEDPLLQTLIADAFTLHEAAPLLGRMADALARRIEEDAKAGLVVPASESFVLEEYRRLVDEKAVAARFFGKTI